jgi:hypothetical protein
MVKLELQNIAGGALADDFAAALEKVRDDLMVDDPVVGKRVVEVKITFDLADAHRGVLSTVHAITVKLPDRKHGGVAWLREGELVTEESCKDTTQMELPAVTGKVRMLRDIEG